MLGLIPLAYAGELLIETSLAGDGGLLVTYTPPLGTKDVELHSNLTQGGCGVKLGLVYAVNPRLARYSMGLSEPREILIRFSLYQRM